MLLLTKSRQAPVAPSSDSEPNCPRRRPPATVLLLSLVSRPDADSDRIADSDSSHPKSSTFLSWPPLGDSRCSFRCAPGCLCPWRVLYGPDAPGEDRHPGRLEDPGGRPGLREDPEDLGRLRRAARFTPIYDLNSY